MKLSLRNFLARYRVTPHCTTGIPPCELLMKRHLRTKLDLFQQTSKEIVKKRTNTKKSTSEVTFKEEDRVWVRNCRKGQKWVQGEILKKLGQKMYQVKVSPGVWR